MTRFYFPADDLQTDLVESVWSGADLWWKLKKVTCVGLCFPDPPPVIFLSARNHA